VLPHQQLLGDQRRQATEQVPARVHHDQLLEDHRRPSFFGYGGGRDVACLRERPQTSLSIFFVLGTRLQNCPFSPQGQSINLIIILADRGNDHPLPLRLERAPELSRFFSKRSRSR